MPCFSMSAMRSASVRSNGGLVSPSTISTVVGWKRDPFWYSGITWREGESLWNCLLDHPLKTHVTLTANWCSHIAALCSGGDPVSGCSGLASEDLPETPQCSNCSSSWWVSPPVWEQVWLVSAVVSEREESIQSWHNKVAQIFSRDSSKWNRHWTKNCQRTFCRWAWKWQGSFPTSANHLQF